MSTDRARVIERLECRLHGDKIETYGSGRCTVAWCTEGGPIPVRYVALDAAVAALRERGEFACGGFEKEAAAFLEAEFGVPQPEQPA